MSVRSIHLRKLLKIMYLPQNKRISALRSDIRDDLAREDGGASSGGDFYGPFWRDAKDHVFGQADLREMTKVRIQANPGRANLYPLLRDGFLEWWDRRRRWTNEPFRPSAHLKTTYRFDDLNATVKLASILSVRDARGQDHFVYPYWFPEPALHEDAARLGLWLLGEALPQIHMEEVRILDIIRGQTFSIDRSPLHGDERDLFRSKYATVIQQWNTLKKDYEGS